MQVALDHYRILMLPLKADEQRIEQAYQERTQAAYVERTLWPGFSAAALTAREQLLTVAVQLLLDPPQREAYDRTLTSNPTLDVEEALLAGALILLCETGDFRSAQELADRMIHNQHSAFTDAVLGLAIARLELGREAWQQEAYEEAAQYLETALTELEANHLFPEVQAELKIDLGKLRPYRILSLVALEESLVQERSLGFSLLESMLDERQGIEGKGQDGSGLGTEDFLRFIQRVRRYLTVAEQETLFKRELDRPSMVATYLLVQVLLTRGYIENRPALMRNARSLLTGLSDQQDVHLEQAICSLLLGQTDEALRHLELTQESEPLAFIQTYSQGAPDLLPGLCHYMEKWFSEEVFQEFRLAEDIDVNLQRYFDNPHVQAYLDEILDAPEEQSTSPQEAYPQDKSTVQIPAFTRPGMASDLTPTALTEPSPVAAPSTQTSTLPPASPSRSTSNGSGPSESSRVPTGPMPPPFFKSGSQPQNPLFTEEDEANIEVPRVADLPVPPTDDLSDYGASMRSRSRVRSEPSPLMKVLPVLALIVGLIVIVLALRYLFRQDQDPEPITQTQTQTDPDPTPTLNFSPTPLPPSPTPDIPLEWQNVTNVRIVSTDGINLRSEPSVNGARLAALPFRSELVVLDVERGDTSFPIWLQVQTSTGQQGWVAAEALGTVLVERL